MSFDTTSMLCFFKYALLLNVVEQIARVSKTLIIKTTLLPEMCQTLKISRATLYRTPKTGKKTSKPEEQLLIVLWRAMIVSYDI
jgi:hypothetical protein